MFNKEAKLQTNPHHKKADTRQLRNPFKKAVISLLGITLSVGLYSGMINVPKAVQVPRAYAENIGSTYEVRDGEYFYTDQELSEIKFFSMDFENINIFEGPDFLEWCPNIVTMKLAIGNSSWQSTLGYISRIPQMPSVTSLYIDTSERNREYNGTIDVLAFDETNIGTILDKFPNLQEITIPGDEFCYFDENTLESYPNIKTLTFKGYTNENCNIDFSKLTHLENLNFNSVDMYTLAINFTKSDYETLKAAGVNMQFRFNNGNTVDEFLTVLDKLDLMIEELNISKDATDTTKINAIITHVLINYSYADEPSDCKNDEAASNQWAGSFYEGGTLSAVFNNEKKEDGTIPIICGNYTALCSALSKRLGLAPYYVLGEGHAYNLWNIEGIDTYYDATWIDGDFIVVIDEIGDYHYHRKDDTKPDGLGREIVWNGFDSTDSDFLDEHDPSGAHRVLNYPEIENIGKDGYPFVFRLNDEQKVNFNIVGKQVVVPLSVVVSIMAGLGAAIDTVKLQKIKSMSQKGRLTAIKMKEEAKSSLTIEQKNEIIKAINDLYSDSNSDKDKIQNLSLDITKKFYYVDMNKETYDMLVGDDGYMRDYCIYYFSKLFELLGDNCDVYPNFLESSDYYLNDFLSPEITRFLRKYGFINSKNSKHLVRPPVSFSGKRAISLN